MHRKSFLEWNVLIAFLKMTTEGHLHIAERNKFQVWVQQKQKSDLLMWFESCLHYASKTYLSDKYFQKYVRTGSAISFIELL